MFLRYDNIFKILKLFYFLFLHFKEPSWTSRCYDWVVIKDGDGSILLDKTCGSEIPPTITSKTSTAKVIFRTDFRDTARGFSLDWEVEEEVEEESSEEPSEEPSGEPGCYSLNYLIFISAIS